jgi:hypothetical protein
MPSFLPISPVILPFQSRHAGSFARLLKLDFHIHPGSDVEFTEGVYGLLRRFQYIQQSFVRADFVLISRFLIHMGRAIDGKSLDPRG